MTSRHHRYQGGCHCGNVTLELGSTRPAGEIEPRACDCTFCRKHGAAYVSDPQGELTLAVRAHDELGRYRHGSEAAEFLLCRRCGVLVGVIHRDASRTYGAVNARVVEGHEGFGPEQVVSPRKLDPAEKQARWKALWFP